MGNLVNNILTTLGARTAIVAVAFITSIILARCLGPEARGLFALVVLVPALARTLALVGFEQANVVYAGLEPDKRETLVWHSVLLAGAMGCIAIIIGSIFILFDAPGLPRLVRGPVWLYLLPLLGVPFTLLTEYWGGIVRGMNYIGLLNLVDIGTKVGLLVLVLVLVGWLKLAIAGAVWATFIVDVVVVIVTGLVLKQLDMWGRPLFDRILWKRTARFALPAHGATVAGYLNYRIDEFVIAALLPTEQLAFYVIAVSLTERLWLIAGSVGNVLLPHIANSLERNPLLPAVIARHVLIWTGGVCVLMFVVADVGVRVLYSSAYAPVVAPVRWLLPGVVILSVGRVLVAELLSREKTLYILAASGAAALANIAGNFILIPHMGISGAAVASSVSYSVLSILLTWGYLREVGVSWTVLVPRRSDIVPYVIFWAHGRSIVRSKVGASRANGGFGDATKTNLEKIGNPN